MAIQLTRRGQPRPVPTTTETSYEAALIFVEALETALLAGLCRGAWEVSVYRPDGGKMKVHIDTRYQPEVRDNGHLPP